jgi:hypothetical protein
MDLTLRNYSESCDKIHDSLNKVSITEAPKILHELESYIKLIQSVAYKAAKIYNAYKRSLQSAEKFKTFIPNDNTCINVNPTKTDCDSNLRISNTKMSNTRVLAPDININPIIVQSFDKVPNTNIYYIEETKQFAVKINGVLLHGNIGEIYPKNAKNVIHVKKCSLQDSCKAFKNGKCKYYHDINVKSKSKTNQDTVHIRNFTSCNWNHTKELKTSKNLHMRHFGSRSSLANDLDILKMDSSKNIEIEQFTATILHDLLVMAALNQKGLIDSIPETPILSKRFSGSTILNLV